MTYEINPSELGAFTNNLPNKEGIKKLVSFLEGKQEKLTAGTNITITDENVISAVGGKVYTAGDNISISEQDVISATDTKYTAGTGISISEQNVISASGGDWTKRTANNDWSDLFDIDNTEVIAKKDIIMSDSTNNSQVIILKGERGTNINKYGVCVAFVSGNSIYYSFKYTIGVGDIPNSISNISCQYIGYSYSNNTFATTTNNNNVTKSSMTIYTRN